MGITLATVVPGTLPGTQVGGPALALAGKPALKSVPSSVGCAAGPSGMSLVAPVKHQSGTCDVPSWMCDGGLVGPNSGLAASDEVTPVRMPALRERNRDGRTISLTVTRMETLSAGSGVSGLVQIRRRHHRDERIQICDCGPQGGH